MFEKICKKIDRRGKKYNVPFLFLYPFRYPNLIILLLTILFAFALFRDHELFYLDTTLSSLGYLGTFFFGVLYTYSFTAAPATAILLILAHSQNIYLTGLIAGFGALIGDLTIFALIRCSFTTELNQLSREKIVRFFTKRINRKFKKWSLWIIGGFFLASPLPDEIGIILLAGTTNISAKTFSIISFLLNTFGIFVILFLVR